MVALIPLCTILKDTVYRQQTTHGVARLHIKPELDSKIILFLLFHTLHLCVLTHCCSQVFNCISSIARMQLQEPMPCDRVLKNLIVAQLVKISPSSLSEPARAMNFSRHRCVQTGSEANSLLSSRYWGLFQWVNAAGA
jgi:hypothetical protein